MFAEVSLIDKYPHRSVNLHELPLPSLGPDVALGAVVVREINKCQTQYSNSFFQVSAYYRKTCGLR